ncbi:MAG: DNA topoisomerase IB [Pseudaminobacter sp.]|nr:DNA topoisomerase IB [Pseudaminobacter sp.]
MSGARDISNYARPEPQAFAEQASLVYVSHEEPGIRRRRSGKGFSYSLPGGQRLADNETLARIGSLAIPPAWTDVWIAADANGHIQATGRDQRGRKQYRYHARWSASRDEAKYSSVAAFAEALPKLRDRVDADLRKRGFPIERVVASVVWLLDNTMIRVGNAAYARDNQSFGLTTLRSRHVKVEGAQLRFAFKGKSGKEWRLQLADRRMARIMRTIQELPGQQLFQYYDDDVRRAISSHDVNVYIQDVIGPEFSSKHFRTWGGTINAASLFSATPVGSSKSETARIMNSIVDRVAAGLGNTRTVCRKCYIHPLIMERWQEGVLADELAAARRSFRKPVAGLDEEETLVLKWLVKNGSASE